MNKDTYERETPEQPKKPKRLLLAILVIVLAAAIAVTLSELRGGPLPTWEELGSKAGLTEPDVPLSAYLAVHFIDVGQGDSILIQAPGGDTMLIDAGERGNEQTVTDYIRKYGDDTLEYVVATHPHADHIGSMDDVIGAFTVRNVLMPRLSEENVPTYDCYQSFLTAVKESDAKTITAKPGFTFSFGKGACTVLSPAGQFDDLNDMSVVLRLDWGDTSFLFTGDAQKDAEEQMLHGQYADLLDVDVLKLGHHGSRTSSSAKFLKAVTPDFAVVSCGKDNDYGHPHRQTLQKLDLLQTAVLRTDTMGSIRMYSDGTAIRVETDRDAE